MKKLLYSLIILLILVAAGSWWIIANAQKLANQYKPNIETALSSALDSTVALGDISVHLFPDLILAVKNLTIKNQPDKSEGLELENLALSIKLSGLLKGQLVIDQLQLGKPNITIVKTKNLTYIEGLKPEKKTKLANTANTAQNVNSRAVKEFKENSSSSALSFNLDSFKITAGEIIFDDRVNTKTTKLNKLDVDGHIKIEDSLITLKDILVTALLGNNLPIKLATSHITYNLQEGQLSIPASTLNFLEGQINSQELNYQVPKQSGGTGLNVTNIALKKLADLLAALELAPLPYEIAGTFAATAATKIAGEKIAVSGVGILTNAGVTIDDKLNISDLNSKINYSYSPEIITAADKETTLRVNSSEFKVDWQAKIAGNKVILAPVNILGLGGTVNLDLENGQAGQKPYTAKIRLSNLDIEKAAKTFVPDLPLKVEGIIKQLDANLSGQQIPDALRTMSGNGQMLVSPAVIKGINIAGEALKAVSNLPFLQEALLAKVPADLRKEFTDPDSNIDQAQLRWNIGNELVNVTELILKSKLWEISGNGTMTLDQKLDFNSELVLNPDLSAAMIRSTKELKYLADEQGSIRFPVNIKGKSPDLVITPQLDKILKSQAGEAVKDKLAEGLGKALGGNKEQGKAIRNLLGF